jgi:hypothetical protein
MQRKYKGNTKKIQRKYKGNAKEIQRSGARRPPGAGWIINNKLIETETATWS